MASVRRVTARSSSVGGSARPRACGSESTTGNVAMNRRPNSGDSARLAGRMILGVRPPSATSSAARSTSPGAAPPSMVGGSGTVESAPHLQGTVMENSLFQILPANLREQLLEVPDDVRRQLLAAAADVLTSGGTGEAIKRMELLAGHMASGAGAAAESQSTAEHARWHGLLGDACWSPPREVARSTQAARPGYNAYSASEYLDHKEVLKAKAALLAQMWRRSGRNTVIYTGAGLSTASGIGDYASKASNSVAPHKKQTSSGSRFDLRPTLAHQALASLGEKGLIGNWVQQNHDRLAQKAGFPQAKLNEIHGAWGDMKNQVKMMDDTLRADLMDWLVAWADNANLCVALGTSLCGMNADQVPRAVAERFAQSVGEGLVIIGLQRTAYDDVASLRIWGLCDDVMKLVAKELGCRAPDAKVAKRGEAWESTHPRLSYNTPTRTARDPL